MTSQFHFLKQQNRQSSVSVGSLSMDSNNISLKIIEKKVVSAVNVPFLSSLPPKQGSVPWIHTALALC